ncbi:hypothetical protein ACFQL7_14305 [Halocatena marina]|uniref:Uncharacterized protein n=1 Tax=Halocatena marina TaxID=2934937 RepID=A0ABD5YTP5_9EURY
MTANITLLVQRARIPSVAQFDPLRPAFLCSALLRAVAMSTST